jgi:glycosyltransferase involved in cell wall biosynthesis
VRVLFVCTQCPEPAHGGAALRTGGWLRTTSRFAEVGVVTLARSQREEEAVEREAERHGWWLRTVRAERTAGARTRDLLLSVLTSTPYLLLAARERRLHDAVREGLRDFRPDIVQAELLPATRYLEEPRIAGVPTVFSAHNIESRIVAGAVGSIGRPGRQLIAGRLRWHERRQAEKATAVVAVSSPEARWFGSIARRVALVPNAVEIGRYEFQSPVRRSGRDLLFTGHLAYPPNRDAARLLASRVFPLVAREVPDIRCCIAGSHPAGDVFSLAGPGVEVIADFADLDSLRRKSGIFVSPLRWGAGTRLKLLEAAALGLPIVATPFSADGLRLEPGLHFLPGWSPEELASAVLVLLRDADRCDVLARAARSAVETHHDWSDLRETIEGLYAGLLGDSGQG